MTISNDARFERARVALEGLSVGDAFGERFFSHISEIDQIIARRTPPRGEWRYTDDTEMALSVVATLRRHDSIDQDELGRSFARRYQPNRGYGSGAHTLLQAMRAGGDWRTLAPKLFRGGSYGNGAAMRVAPLGAYFADDLDQAVEQARRSAEVTHSHAEGIAGAVAVAAAAAWAWRIGHGGAPADTHLLDLVLPHVPASEVADRLRRARAVLPGTPAPVVGAMLGNGSAVSAQDTVPYALWCASRSLDDYAEALWTTVTALGDIDTNCAIVGGVVVCAAGLADIPLEWRQQRERLPIWPFREE